MGGGGRVTNSHDINFKNSRCLTTRQDGSENSFKVDGFRSSSVALLKIVHEYAPGMQFYKNRPYAIARVGKAVRNLIQCLYGNPMADNFFQN